MFGGGLMCEWTDVGSVFFFFFNDTATTEIYTLSLHDALPILLACVVSAGGRHTAHLVSRSHHGAGK